MKSGAHAPIKGRDVLEVCDGFLEGDDDDDDDDDTPLMTRVNGLRASPSEITIGFVPMPKPSVTSLYTAAPPLAHGSGVWSLEEMPSSTEQTAPSMPEYMISNDAPPPAAAAKAPHSKPMPIAAAVISQVWRWGYRPP